MNEQFPVDSLEYQLETLIEERWKVYEELGDLNLAIAAVMNHMKERHGEHHERE